MDNPAIRRRAWQLYRQNFKRFLLIGIVLALIYVAYALFTMGIPFIEPTLVIEVEEVSSGPLTIYANRDSVREVTSEVWAFVTAVLFWPIISAGVMRVGWQTWQGNKPHVRDLFAFTHPVRTLFKTLTIAVFATLLNLKIIPLITLILTGDFSPKTGTGLEMLTASDGLGPLYVTVKLMTGIVAIWTGLRLYLVNFLPSDEPELGVFGVIGRSWRTMRDALSDAIGMNISMCWLYAPVFVANIANFPAPVNLALMGLMMIMGVLFAGYVTTAYAGLAHEILHPTSEVDANANEATDRSAAGALPPIDPPLKHGDDEMIS